MNEALCLKNGWLGVSAANAQRSPSGGLPAFDPSHPTGPSHPSERRTSQMARVAALRGPAAVGRLWSIADGQDALRAVGRCGG